MNIKTDSLWIGEFLKLRIDGILPLYPCVASAGAPDTFAVYRRTSYSGRDTKDIGNYEETIYIEIAIVAPLYAKSIDIAQRVKDSLDGLRGRWKDKQIDSIVMTDAKEEFNTNAYVQTLSFAISLDT